MRTHWERFGTTGPRPFSSSRPGRSSTRAVWKAQVAVLRAPHSASSTFDPRGNGQSDRPPESSPLRRARARRPTRSPSSTRRAAERAASSSSSRSARSASLIARGRASGARRRRSCSSAPTIPLAIRRSAPESTFERRARDVRGLGEVQRELLAPRLPRLRRSSSSVRRCFTEPHSTKQIEDCVGWGARDRTARPSSRAQYGPSSPTARRCSSSARASSAPCS